jgi:hypothetical protein
MPADDLGYFRVEIEMVLEDLVELDSGDGDAPNVANGYYLLFGVTAASFAEAVECVENALGEVTSSGARFPGWLVQLQVDTWTEPPAGAERELLQDPSARGIHYISDRAYFLALDESDG